MMSIAIAIYYSRTVSAITNDYRKCLTIILFFRMFFLTLPCRSAYNSRKKRSRQVLRPIKADFPKVTKQETHADHIHHYPRL